MASFRRTKIIATMGPSSWKPDVFRRLVGAGMNAVRINSAHGTIADYNRVVKLARLYGVPVIMDIKGPELRIRVHQGLGIRAGETRTVHFSDSNGLFFSHDIRSKLRVGDALFIADGAVQARVVEITSSFARLKFRHALSISSSKNVTVPGRRLLLPSLSPHDEWVLEFVKRHHVSFVALSYAEKRSDIDNVRKKVGSNVSIIAKIESARGVDRLDEIAGAADGVMIARGSLGVELPLARVPVVQKQIIQKVRPLGKFVITATQMLESMVNADTPTRAEASDVANAVFDGSDALMLSAETATGNFPVQAVSTMAEISRVNELFASVAPIPKNPNDLSDALTHSLVELCRGTRVKAVISLTQEGSTAMRLARFHLLQPVIALTSNARVVHRLALFFGVEARKAYINGPHRVLKAMRFALHEKLLSINDIVVFTGGLHTLQSHTSNLIELHRAADLLSYAKKTRQLKTSPSKRL